MSSQYSKGEFKKLSKRRFASPVGKPQQTCFVKREPELQCREEDASAERIPTLLSHGTSDKVATKPKKTWNGQHIRQKGHTPSTDKKPSWKESQEKAKDGEGCLTAAQFEELVQSVLQKPLQECMDMLIKENPEKRAALAKPAQKQRLRRKTLGAHPTLDNGTSGKESGEKSEVVLPEAEQEYQLQTKKHSAPLVHEGREKNEKPEADNGGRKENRKGAPQKKVQGNARVVTDQEEMQEQGQEEEEADGGSDKCMAWVQCSYPTCKKWRRLSSDVDPSVLPEDWSCSQNTDLQYNNCSIAEEVWSGSENEVVYAVYIPGSIVWAKQYGHPWWPGIVEADPDIGEYFLFSSQTDSLPSKYHVTFFGKTVTRAWISASLLRSFGETNVEGSGLAKLKSKGDKKNLEAALTMAKEAAQISIQERIRIFGFRSRFSRKEPPKDHKDVKDHAALVTCKPQAKRIQRPSGGNKNSAASSRSPNKLLPGTAVKKQHGGVSKEISLPGSRKRKLTSEASTSLLKKSQRDIQPPKTAPVPKGSGKARKPQSDQKSFKKSFSVPQCRNIKAEHASSCANSSTAGIVSPSYASKEDSLNKAVAESKPVLSTGDVILEESNGVAAVDNDEEELFSSQEMSVFAEEEKDYSPEDFSLVLFEE